MHTLVSFLVADSGGISASIPAPRFCIILPLMRNFFARRTSWNLTTNRYTQALEAHRRAGREVLDLTASNPTTIGLRYREDELLQAWRIARR